MVVAREGVDLCTDVVVEVVATALDHLVELRDSVRFHSSLNGVCKLVRSE